MKDLQKHAQSLSIRDWIGIFIRAHIFDGGELINQIWWEESAGPASPPHQQPGGQVTGEITPDVGSLYMSSYLFTNQSYGSNTIADFEES